MEKIGHEYTDRYEAAGVPYPDPETMCKGQCDGMGCYPQSINDPDITEEERVLWESAHGEACIGIGPGNVIYTRACDGCHFITCPDCGGTGKRSDAA